MKKYSTIFKPELHPIEAKEGDNKKRKYKLLDIFRDRFKYDIKKTEVLLGKYDLNVEVILSHKALTKANVYCGIVQKTQGSIEVMGLLVGNWNNDILTIEDAYIGNCHSSHTYTEMEPTEIIKLNKLAKANGLSVVGQWHYHPQMATNPSGTDDDFMINLERFKVRTPVQLITNLNDFTLTMMVNGRRKNVDFIIPPANDTYLGIDIGFINNEGSIAQRRTISAYDPYTGHYTYNQIDSNIGLGIKPFYGWLGRKTKFFWGWLLWFKRKPKVEGN